MECGTPSGRRTLWSCWKGLFIMVENRGTRRQWGILLLLPHCQNKLGSYCLFNSVSSLLLQLFPQEQIGSPSVMTFITYLWVFLITLNVFATHLDFSKCSDNFGQKTTKPLVLIQITQSEHTYCHLKLKNSITQLSSCAWQIQSHRLSSNNCCPVPQALIMKTPWKFLAQRKTSQYTHQDTTRDKI